MRQTAFDLLEMGYDVHVVVDACSSMQQHDRNVGIESMSQQGVTMITFQSLVFELLRGADHPLFKAHLPLLKDNPEEKLDLHYMKQM